MEGKKDFRIFSTAFKDGEMIPIKHTAEGLNVSPPLEWENPPEGTKSFALICDDPVSPEFTVHHWLVKDIPASAKEIPEGANIGKALPNIAGQPSYFGPKPPSGVHTYYFKLYALNTDKLNATNRDEIYKEVEEKKISQATLTGKYTPQKPAA